MNGPEPVRPLREVLYQRVVVGGEEYLKRYVGCGFRKSARQLVAVAANPRIHADPSAVQHDPKRRQDHLALAAAPQTSPALDIRLDHRRDQRAEACPGLPAQHLTGLRGVAEEEVDLSGPHEAGVLDDMISPVEPDMFKGDLTKLLNRVAFPGSDDIVIRGGLLQHEPHGFHVVSGETPIPLGIEIAHAKFFGEPKLDSRHSVAHFARYEFEPAPRRLVIE